MIWGIQTVPNLSYDTKTWSTYQKHMNDTLRKNNLLLCCKQKQQEYNHLCDKMWAKHSSNTVTYYMNIIQNKYQGTNQQGSIFPDQAHIHNYIQIIFITNHKNRTVHMATISKNLYIFSDDRGVLCLFCLWIAVRFRLSWTWRWTELILFLVWNLYEKQLS